MQKSLFAPHSTGEKFAGKGAEGNFQLATIPRKEERRRLSDGRRVSSKNKRKSSTRVSISSANLDERSVLLSPYLWYQRSAPHGSDALPSFDFLNPTRDFLYVEGGDFSIPLFLSPVSLISQLADQISYVFPCCRPFPRLPISTRFFLFFFLFFFFRFFSSFLFFSFLRFDEFQTDTVSLKGFFLFFFVFLREGYCVNRYRVKGDLNSRNLRIVRKLIENANLFDLVNIEGMTYKLRDSFLGASFLACFVILF